MLSSAKTLEMLTMAILKTASSKEEMKESMSR